MTHLVVRRVRATVLAAVAVSAAVLGLGPAEAAVADDATAAWSVSPSDASGTPDGRTRLELALDPGATATEHLQVANASTTEQTFTVYGADAFNTATGGYDLEPAATTPDDVGSWVTVDHPTLTIPALSTAVVTVSVAVPAGASPGDHPGGVVASVARPADAGGVVVDTRVAVRLAVRVSGELTPALEVRDVHGSLPATIVPFGAATASVGYDVVNTGNVTIVGTPRVRVTGPFGVRLAESKDGATQEVLPGQSFQVTTPLAGVVPLGVETAVVDVTSVAQPRDGEQVPMVSATESSTFPAVPWTGLLVLALVVLAVWLMVRRARRRRREGEDLWAAMVEEAGRAGLPAGPVRSLALVAGLLAVLPAVLPAETGPGPASSPASLQLYVPPAATTAGPTTAPVVGAGSTSSGPSSGSGDDDFEGTDLGALPEDGVVGDDGSTGAGDAPGGEATPVPAAQHQGADLLWRDTDGPTPGQWTLLGLGAASVAGLGVLGGRALLRARRLTIAPGVPGGEDQP